MSDLISRESVRLGKVPPYGEYLSLYERGWNDACDAIADNAPSAEPEIIRCKDCEYNIECCRNIRSEGRKPDDFCSFAERREDD